MKRMSRLMFQHTAARRRLLPTNRQQDQSHRFQHTAARRRLNLLTVKLRQFGGFNTQPPEGGCAYFKLINGFTAVSTHSRPKAAVLVAGYESSYSVFQHTAARRRLAHPAADRRPCLGSFNTQPPEGGWRFRRSGHGPLGVSTHSRLKAAGARTNPGDGRRDVSTHSRLKAAGFPLITSGGKIG